MLPCLTWRNCRNISKKRPYSTCSYSFHLLQNIDVKLPSFKHLTRHLAHRIGQGIMNPCGTHNAEARLLILSFDVKKAVCLLICVAKKMVVKLDDVS